MSFGEGAPSPADPAEEAQRLLQKQVAEEEKKNPDAFREAAKKAVERTEEGAGQGIRRVDREGKRVD